MKHKRIKTKEAFIERARQIHGTKYSYDNAVFTPRDPILSHDGKKTRKLAEYNRSEKIIVTCPNHGDFPVTARKHIENGPGAIGCKYCSWEMRSEVRYNKQKEADFTNCNRYSTDQNVITIYSIPADGIERHILLSPEDLDVLKYSKWHVTGYNPSSNSRTNYCIGQRSSRMKSENLQWLGTYPKLHRLIMSRVLGRKLKRGEVIDHINHNGLDNRRENLRIVTHSQNHANQKKQKGNYSSIYKGVMLYRDGKRWQAYIGSAKGKVKREYLGQHDTEESAAKAYDKRAKELFGDYAHLNFPEEKQ